MTEPGALSSRMCRKHLCHHLPFWLFSTEGKKESIWRREVGRRREGKDLWLKRHCPAQSCHSLSNYTTSNNSAFSYSQLQISPLGCRLSVPLPCAGKGCMCVCVCTPIRVGRWEWTFSGWEMTVLSHITRQTSKPTVVSWCDVDSNRLGWNRGAAGWPSSGSYACFLKVG